MENQQTPSMPLEARARTSRWVMLGAATSLALSGCNAISDTVETAAGNLAVMQMENKEAYDYSLWPACAKPVVELLEPIKERIAEQCNAAGSKDAELVVVDLTESEDKTERFMKDIQDGIEEITKGHITVNPRLFGEVSIYTKETIAASLSTKDEAEPCVDIDDKSTYPSTALLEKSPELKQVPYFVVLSDYLSCGNTSAGILSGTNSVVLFNYSEMDSEYASNVGEHELGHLIFGLGHVGTLAPIGYEGDPSRYVLTKNDLTFGMIHLPNYPKLADYREYVPQDAVDSNIMGSADIRNSGGALMPHQQDQLHWWDEVVGESYSPNVSTIGTEVVEFKPTDSSNRAGLAMLEEPITILGNANDKDMVADGVLFQPITGFDENIGEVVESVFISFVSTEGSRTALVGFLTKELSGERSWVLNIGPNKTLHLNSVSGPLLAHITG